MHKQILLTGGAGYVGAHVAKALAQQGYDLVILDNLETGKQERLLYGTFIQGDISDVQLLNTLFEHYNFNAVLHFAASTSVSESVLNPQKYYQNNFINSLTLLKVMLAHQVNKIIFASSAAVYGATKEPVIALTHPMQPINPYGHSKLMFEQTLKDYHKAYGLNYMALRYFNVAGADPDLQLGEVLEDNPHLIPRALDVILGRQKELIIFGDNHETFDGTCIRDYIHVNDICNAHLLALDHLQHKTCAAHYNLGSGQGTSIKEVLNRLIQISNKSIPVIIKPKRPGEPPALVADINLTNQQLSWAPRYSALSTIIEHAWAWVSKRYSISEA